MFHIVRLIVLLAVRIPILFDTNVFAASVGDQVELNGTHPAGVPFH
jgi:hypothetical protein